MTRYQHTQTEVRIRRAIGAMPYGGGREPIRGASRKVGLDDRGVHQPVTLESVAVYLEALGEVLSDVAEQNRQDEVELRQLRSDVAAVRRLLGIGGDK